MQKIIVVALIAGLATIFGMRAIAQTNSNMEAAIKAQCPGAAAWYSAPHDGLSTDERHKLKSIKPSDPALTEQLAQRYRRDQAAEEAAIKVNAFSKSKAEAMKLPEVQHLLTVQRADLGWFKKIFAAHGFPTAQQVGLQGVEHAWMIVQHANTDRKFQEQVLTSLQPQLASESFLRNDYASLIDRVRSEDNKPQIYGTQFTTKDGRLVMKSTENEPQLDERRATMELMPIADYRCFLEVMYHLPTGAASSDSAPATKSK